MSDHDQDNEDNNDNNIDQQVDEMNPDIMTDDLEDQDLTDLGAVEPLESVEIETDAGVVVLPDAVETEELEEYAEGLNEANELEDLYQADDDSTENEEE